MTESILRFCPGCRSYTLRGACGTCGAPTRTPHPARFSPQDRWAKYRRALLDEAGRPSGGA
ncbi:MAG TPA: RNA-protein complex protein Nop10 [Thermoplasmata archaeon]|nr:RNA-protein complex protein Nop10 [Thermoplasmata archaeon]